MLRAPLLTAAGRPDAARLRVAVRPPAGRAALVPALGLGLLAALLFSTTFVANRSIHLGGGAWECTASLRYLMMLPLLAVPRTALRAAMRAWARMVVAMLRVIAGVRLDLRGMEHIPPGACVIAAKHQSAFDTAVWLA